MSSQADLYFEWLQIPDGPRPPDHYGLLGIERGESSVERINAAADARVKIVRPRCLKYPEEGTRLLNEIAQARLCLTDDDERQAYDQGLAVVSVSNVTQWSRLHAGTFDLKSLTEPEVSAETQVAMSAETAAEEPETYRLCEPVAAPESPPPQANSRLRRLCPHCGTQLLTKATFCHDCSMSEVASTRWMDFKCRSCHQKQRAGMVICRKCLSDLAIFSPPVNRPQGSARNEPYHFAEWFAQEGYVSEPVAPKVAAPAAPKPVVPDPVARRPESSEEPLQEFSNLTPRQLALAKKQIAKDVAQQREAEQRRRKAAMVVGAILASIAGVLVIGVTTRLLLATGRTSRPANGHAESQSTTVAAPSDSPPATDASTASTTPVAEKSDSAAMPSSSPPADPFLECDRILEVYLKTLKDPQSTVDELLAARERVLSVDPCRDPAERDRLANDLRQAASDLRKMQLNDSIAKAQTDAGYVTLWETLSQGPERDYLDPISLDSLQKSLNQHWHDFSLKQYESNLREQLAAGRLRDAFDSAEMELPEQIAAVYEESWEQTCERSFQKLLNNHLQTVQDSVSDQMKRQQFGDVVRLLNDLDELQEEIAHPLLENFLKSQRTRLFEIFARFGIRAQGDAASARTIVSWMLEDEDWKTRGAALREQLIALGEWEQNPLPERKIKPVKIDRTPFVDPPRDYAADKKLYAKQVQSARDRQRFYSWYSRLERNYNGHRAGYFIFIKDGRVYMVSGLAKAAFEILQIDPLDAPGKREPVQTDWYGTLSEARRAYPQPATILD